MIPKRIEGATHYLGAPAAWKPEEDGNCAHLAIRRTVDGCCESAWELTPAELDALNKGASVILSVKGGQPPVMLYVAQPASLPPSNLKGGE